MTNSLSSLPWQFIGIGYLGFLVYILTSLINPADESLSAIKDVFVKKGRTVLTAFLVTPFLVLAAENYGQLNGFSAFFAGYFNISIIRKVGESWQSRQKMLGN